MLLQYYNSERQVCKNIQQITFPVPCFQHSRAASTWPSKNVTDSVDPLSYGASITGVKDNTTLAQLVSVSTTNVMDGE